ncbi:MAG: hypothetical protein ACE37F_04720 [Nannocystaceae bacterium]|nr:WD40 domain-containing protein [bacterium]
MMGSTRVCEEMQVQWGDGDTNVTCQVEQDMPPESMPGSECASFSPDGTRIVTASADNTARVWVVAEVLANPRTILWQTPFCHSVRRRNELLGEPESLARANHERCLELTTLCSTQPYEACDAAVTQAFAGELGSG